MWELTYPVDKFVGLFDGAVTLCMCKCAGWAKAQAMVVVAGGHHHRRAYANGLGYVAPQL